ncbi:F-box WD repeat-containing 7-like isoform X2 [Paramuricea clavata]|nr:F-box WD repeat-containing 7-like isoform X2 [Paramuricea clavata]
MIKNMEKNLQINQENSQNTADVLNEQTQQRVPVPQTAVLDNKLAHEEKPSANKNGDHSESTSGKPALQTRDSAIARKTKGSSPQETVTSKPSVSSSQSQSMKESGKKRGARLNDWEEKTFTTKCLEGHNDLISSVGMEGTVLISGSRDTMLKVWDTDTGEEVRSMGGHTGGITSVLLVKKDNQGEQSNEGYIGVTGSHDCSIRIWSLADGKPLRSIYAYSPVLSLDRRKGVLLSGSEGGKVELWDLEVGDDICSTRNTDDDAVTCVKFQGERVVSGSSTGTVKVWDVRQKSLSPSLSSPDQNTAFGKRRRVHCLATTDDVVYWGDDGTNIKALDIRAGKVRKLKNHLTEFGSTSALIVQDSLLISSGYDLDKGTGYLNVRTLPDEEYLATLDDEITSYISCLCCTEVQKDGTLCQRLCTGGNELKIWDQMAKTKIRKRTRSDGDSSFITSKHIKRYSSTEQIDTESSDESDDENRDSSSDDDDENEGGTTTARQSWCTIS